MTAERTPVPAAPTVRLDLWLWAVRVFKTRSVAATACRSGHVTINATVAKAASPVRIGDRVEARIDAAVGHRQRVLEVVQLIDKRVGPPIAATCWVDHSPPPPPDEYAHVFRRDPGAGRPTKRDRRTMDRFRNR